MLKRALVTGGAGFIGSHLVDRLDDLRWKIDVVDNLSSGCVEFLRQSIREKSLIVEDFASPIVSNRIKSGCYDFVFHLAAIPRVSYSVEHPLKTHEVNLTKSLQLIDVCRGNIKKFVFASSSAVYGNTDVLPTPEDADKNPKSPYALQKLMVEDYLRLYFDLYQFESTSLRFFNVFGPRQFGDGPYSTAVSAWLTSIMNGRMMRSDGDGTQTRDMCYVSNVVDACIAAVDGPRGMRDSVYNVACGERISNNEILESLKREFPNSTSKTAPWRAGDVMHTQADISKISTDLGYTPRVSFWDGLTKTIAWYRDVWSHQGGGA